MKKRFLITFSLVISCVVIWAQGLPSGINYQAVGRDTKGQPISNKKIDFKITLLAGDVDGKTVYTETHQVNTNESGMFSLVVGQGKALRGEFISVPWSEKQIWMEVSIDEDGSGKFLVLNTSKLMSVPYAFHAGTADAVVGEESSGRNDLGPSAFWKVNGNNMTFPGSMFMGTIDFKDLVFKTNSIEAMRIGAAGDINIKNTLNVGVDINVGRDANIGRDANLGRNLNVEGIARFNNTAQSNTKDDGSVIVEGGVGIEKNINIGGNTEIDGTLGVDGVSTLKNTTESTTKDNGALVVEGGVGIEKNVNIGGNTEIDGTLGVDGVSTLKNTTQSTTKDNGALVVEGGVGIEKNVNIGGNTEIDGTLGVDGISMLKNTTQSTTKDNGALIVEGGVGVEKNINVGGNSSVTGNSIVEGNSTVNGITGLNGQVTISANVGGGSDNYGAYPLRVEGSEQGVAIKLSVGTPLGANNFLTFFNSSGNAVGGVEGQDYAEKQAWPPNVFDRSLMIANEIKCGVAIGLSFIPTCTGGFIVSCGVSGAAIAMAAADLILASANLIAFEVFLSQYIGVTYSSGSADYAEWLERAYPEEQISAGDIVAVNGGKITKYTENAQQYMAISTNPAILGNVPSDGNVSNMEKVAFMGQIPVKVRGIVLTGDYILPSGLHDGIGIAVSPDKITAEQYRKIVGVAWSNSFLEKGVSYINMAIGLNSNDVSTLVAKQEKKIKEIENKNKEIEKKYKSLEDRLIALENGTRYIPTTEIADAPNDQPTIESIKVMSREETIANQMPSELSDDVMKEAMLYLETEYKRRGINTENHPGLHKLLTDMDFQAEVIVKAKETYKSTYQNFVAGLKN